MKNIPAKESWLTRKKVFLQNLRTAPIEAKIICLSDKLSNMRLTAETHAKKGAGMWKDFNQSDEAQQEWYYRSIAEQLQELKWTKPYAEYVKLCDEVFNQKQNQVWETGSVLVERHVIYEPQTRLYKDENLLEFLEETLNMIHFLGHNIFSPDCNNEVVRKMPHDLPIVLLSDKIYHYKCGSYNTEDILQKVKDLLVRAKCEEVKEFLRKILEMIQRIYAMEGDGTRIEVQILREKLNEEIYCGTEKQQNPENDTDNSILNQLKDILNKWTIELLKLGEFIAEHNIIIIYYNAISKKDNNTYSMAANVLAHEYFHYIHNAINKDTLYPTQQNKVGNILAESLADYFAFLWSVQKGDLMTAEHQYHGWKRDLFTASPYAKALLYLKEKYTGILPGKFDSQNNYVDKTDKFIDTFQGVVDRREINTLYKGLWE